MAFSSVLNGFAVNSWGLSEGFCLYNDVWREFAIDWNRSSKAGMDLVSRPEIKA